MSVKYQAYPEYVDSNISSIPKIPSHWITGKVKYVTESLDNIRIPLSAEERGEKQGHYPYYGASGVIDHVDDYLFDEDTILFGEDGANLVARSTPLAFLAKGKYWVNNHAHILKTKDGVNDYWVMCLENIDVTTVVSGAAQPKLTAEALGNLQIVYPLNILERRQIANFLDHETAKIDTLIEKQQQLIKLLKEKRQAVISHAVTKGLNPNAPMRDSGVEWLGEVPEHWVVRRLKHTSKLQSGIPKGKDLSGKVSISLPMLRVANVQDGYLNLEDIHKMKIEPEQLERYTLEKGDVLMNEGGDNDKLGRGAVWQCEIEPCIHQNHVFAIRPFSIEPEWLDLLTRASYAKFHFFRVAKQSTNLASISSTNIKETPLVIPPENERHEIMDYVHGKINAFDKAEEKCSAQIILLQERRTALISAAVTGKIDVRNWQPSHD